MSNTTMNSTTDTIDPRLAVFVKMSPSEQRIAIRGLFDAGFGSNSISRATGLAVAMVRQILADKQETT